MKGEQRMVKVEQQEVMRAASLILIGIPGRGILASDLASGQ